MSEIDPYESEEYQKFVESVSHLCRCSPECNRPCGGVLAGGLCDDLHFDRESSENEQE